METAERIGYTIVNVSKIRRRYVGAGGAGSRDRPELGQPPTITARERPQIVASTL